MAARKSATAKKAAPRRRAPAKKKSTAKKAAPRKKAAQKRTASKPAANPRQKCAPKIDPSSPIGVSEAVERFLKGAELTGEAVVKAAIARRLAKGLEEADPPTAPAIARELQAALVGILPKDAETHDDWTTRL